MDPRFLDMLHDPGDEGVLAIGDAINIDLDRIGEVAIEQQRVLAENRVDLSGLVVGITGLHIGGDQAGQGAQQVILELSLVMDDGHGPATEHIGRAHHERQAEIGDDQACLLHGIGDAVLRLLEAELVEQALEAVAVFRKVDRVGGRCRGSAPAPLPAPGPASGASARRTGQ